MRYVNLYLFKFPVKYEGLDTVEQFVIPNGHMIKFDVKSGYHHLDIFEQHQDYLRFSGVLEGVVRYFKFTDLPFGLSSACSIFTKFLKPLLRHWRFKGYLAILYLDDGFITSHNFTKGRTRFYFFANSKRSLTGGNSYE